jgi:hypothetical protein
MRIISIILALISVALLLIYGSDVVMEMISGNSFLGIDNASRGIFFGGPALILPIFANYAAKKDQFWPLSAMILSSGILIVLGGIVMSGEYILKQSMQEISQKVTLREMEWRSYDPVLFEVGMLISIGGFQILLAVKQLRIISRSAHGV